MHKKHRKPTPGSIRIIAGQWRGRRLPVPDAPGLRPTTDRLRETLFNWLQPWTVGAHCLDAFAGAGGLGFEAASRGAASVLLLEKDAMVAAHLRDQVMRLQAPQIQVLQADALQFLRHTAQSFDLVWLDPPFASSLLPACLEALQRPGVLRPGARVYVECAVGQPAVWGDPWCLQRQTQVGEVTAVLLCLC